MRIAFVTPEYVTEENFDGGLANYLHRTCRALLEMGHEPIIIVTSSTNCLLRTEGIEIHRIKLESRLFHFLGRLTFRKFPLVIHWLAQSWILNRKLAELNNVAPISVVQYSSYMATGIFRIKKVPSVVRISSFNPLMRWGYESATTWQDRLLDLLETLAVRRADAAFGPSRLIASVVSEATRRTVRVIESPYVGGAQLSDESVYSKYLKGRCYALFFGTLGALKGVDTLAGAASKLLAQDPSLHLVLAGKDGGFKNGSMLDYVLESVGPARDRVVYLGKLPRSQLLPVLREAAIVVLPSKVDNLPNTCIEAMAIGKIVVGTRGASLDQLIEHRKSGILSDPGNEESLRKAMAEALALTSVDRKMISEAAAERIRALNPEKVLGELLGLYEGVIRRGRLK